METNVSSKIAPRKLPNLFKQGFKHLQVVIHGCIYLQFSLLQPQNNVCSNGTLAWVVLEYSVEKDVWWKMVLFPSFLSFLSLQFTVISSLVATVFSAESTGSVYSVILLSVAVLMNMYDPVSNVRLSLLPRFQGLFNFQPAGWLSPRSDTSSTWKSVWDPWTHHSSAVYKCQSAATSFRPNRKPVNCMDFFGRLPWELQPGASLVKRSPLPLMVD